MTSTVLGLHGDMPVGLDQFRVTFDKGGRSVIEGTEVFQVLNSSGSFLPKNCCELRLNDQVREGSSDNYRYRKVVGITQETRTVKDIWMDGLSNTDVYGFSNGRVTDTTRLFRDGAVRLRGLSDVSHVACMTKFTSDIVELQATDMQGLGHFSRELSLKVTSDHQVLMVMPTPGISWQNASEKWMSLDNINVDALAKGRYENHKVVEVVYRGPCEVYGIEVKYLIQDGRIGTTNTICVNGCILKVPRIP